MEPREGLRIFNVLNKAGAGRTKKIVMKKLVLFVVGGFMMMSCGEKEMLPQEVEIHKLQDGIEFFQNEIDSTKKYVEIKSDSVEQYLYSINNPKSFSDSVKLQIVAFDLFYLEQMNIRSFEKLIEEKKREQERLAILVTALKK